MGGHPRNRVLRPGSGGAGLERLGEPELAGRGLGERPAVGCTEAGDAATRDYIPPWELFLYFCLYKTQEDIKHIVFMKVRRGVQEIAGWLSSTANLS